MNAALLQEAHQRCGNDLQSIVSLLSLQGRRAKSEETRGALSDVTDRFAVMAHARSAISDGGFSTLQVALGPIGSLLLEPTAPHKVFELRFPYDNSQVLA